MLKCHSEEKAHNLIRKWNKPQGLQEEEEEEERKEEKCKSENGNTRSALRICVVQRQVMNKQIYFTA
jgi:predicted lipoprotein